MGIKGSRSGFTIVELLIVIVVIGVLAAISLVAYNGITNRAKNSAALSDAQQIGKKVVVYSISNADVLPSTLTDVGVEGSGNVTYQYTLNTTTSPDLFCVTVTKEGTSSHVAGSTSGIKKPTLGPCPGHTGTSPTVLADGTSCPAGYIVVPGSSLYDTDAFCVMKYEAKDVAGIATSQASSIPWVDITQPAAISAASAACSGCHLITENEWLTIAQNILSVPSNWSGGSVGSGFVYSGHNDGSPNSPVPASVDDNDSFSYIGGSAANQRRTLTLTNGEVIWDLAGNADEWTSATVQGDAQPGGNMTNEQSSAWYFWRDWNALSERGNLLVDPFPNYANPNAQGWTSAQGVGRAFTSASSSAGSRVFMRGGGWGSMSNAGIYTLNLLVTSVQSGPDVGFRVTR